MTFLISGGGFFKVSDRLLVEVGHHLLERSVSRLVGFAELLQDLRRKVKFIFNVRFSDEPGSG